MLCVQTDSSAFAQKQLTALPRKCYGAMPSLGFSFLMHL